MKYVYVKDGMVADVARVDPLNIFAASYAAQFIEAPDEVEGGWLYDGAAFSAPPVLTEPIPEEVSMAQCRLALYDLHGIEIETDEQFYALADILPEADRARARFELRTRGTVRYDNPLVIAFCAAKGWDREALFVYGAAQ